MSGHPYAGDPFKFPTWVKHELGKEQPETSKNPDAYELSVLREFYKAWDALHSIQGDKRNKEVKRLHQEAAEKLVTAANFVKAIYRA